MNIVDVIRSLAGFAWLAAIGLGVLAVTRVSRNQGAKGIGSTVVIVLVLAIVFLENFLVASLFDLALRLKMEFGR
jgi:hypothetical protein